MWDPDVELVRDSEPGDTLGEGFAKQPQLLTDRRIGGDDCRQVADHPGERLSGITVRSAIDEGKPIGAEGSAPPQSGRGQLDFGTSK